MAGSTMAGRLCVAAAIAAALCLAGPAAASASRIVYECKPNLCAVDPATGVTSPLTTDGTDALPYRDPSASADGARLAARRGDDVLVGAYGGNLSERWNGSQGLNDVALSPDGAALAESHSYVQNVNRVRCYPFAGCQLELVLEDFSAASYSRGVSAEGNTKGFAGGGGVGFLGNGALLTSFYTLGTDTHTVCVIATPDTPTDPPCGAKAEEAGATLSWPDGSPDSTLIAAAKGPKEGDGPSVVNLYDAATGAFVREVAGGTTPAFSPDGASIAFQAPDGSIAVVPTAGGTPRRIVAGAAPTWTAGAGPGPQLAATRLRHAKGRIPVAVRCEGRVDCRGVVQIRKGGTTLGKRRYRIPAGRSARVVVRASARGRRALAKARRHQVVVRLAPRGATPSSTRLVLSR
jgi:hypothetical protein